MNLASEIITGGNTQLSAVFRVVINASLNSGGVGTITLECAIDGSDGCTEALVYDRPHVLHPVPQCCLERHHNIVRHCLWSAQSVEIVRTSCWPIVEVPRQLDRTTTVVPFARRTWILCYRFLVAVILACTIYLFDVAKICTPSSHS